MKSTKKIWGIIIFIVAIYVGITLFVPSLPNVSIIKAIVSIFLLEISIKGIPRLKFYDMLLPVAVIFIMFKKELGNWLNFNEENISGWAIIGVTFLMCMGLDMIFSDCKKKKKMERYKGIKINKTVEFDDDGNIINDDVINSKTAFSSVTKYVDSEDFTHAYIECAFGNTVVYFDKAKIPSGLATVKFDSAFGNIVLYVPNTWNVVDKTSSVGCAIKEKGTSLMTGPTLELRGDVAFAHIVIEYINV